MFYVIFECFEHEKGIDCSMKRDPSNRLRCIEDIDAKNKSICRRRLLELEACSKAHNVDLEICLPMTLGNPRFDSFDSLDLKEGFQGQKESMR